MASEHLDPKELTAVVDLSKRLYAVLYATEGDDITYNIVLSALNAVTLLVLQTLDEVTDREDALNVCVATLLGSRGRLGLAAPPSTETVQ